jgi:predicted transposase/invertase (TIGR01784 family)
MWAMLVSVDPKNDYAFKSVFGSERHTRVLVHLLNAILGPYGLHVKSVRIRNPFSEIRDLDEKKLILDVRAQDDAGRRYNIEMQMVPSPSTPGRFLYYWSTEYSSQLGEGDEYVQLCPVISIFFVDGIMFPNTDRYHLRFQILEQTDHFPFTRHLEMHVFQLPLFTKTVDELTNDLDLWLYIMNNAEGLDVDNLPIRLRTSEVEEVLRALMMLKEDQVRREIYAAREKARRDARDWQIALEHAQKLAQESYARGHEEGLKEGRDEGLKEGHDEGLKEGRDQGLKEGRDQGLDKGELIGEIRALEGMLDQARTSRTELAAISDDDLKILVERLREKLPKH